MNNAPIRKTEYIPHTNKKEFLLLSTALQTTHGDSENDCNVKKITVVVTDDMLNILRQEEDELTLEEIIEEIHYLTISDLDDLFNGIRTAVDDMPAHQTSVNDILDSITMKIDYILTKEDEVRIAINEDEIINQACARVSSGAKCKTRLKYLFRLMDDFTFTTRNDLVEILKECLEDSN